MSKSTYFCCIQLGHAYGETRADKHVAATSASEVKRLYTRKRSLVSHPKVYGPGGDSGDPLRQRAFKTTFSIYWVEFSFYIPALTWAGL